IEADGGSSRQRIATGLLRPGALNGELVRRTRVTADHPTVAAWEVDRLVAVVPAHPVVLALTPHDVEHFAFAAGLADVRAFHDDSVTRLRVHGEPPFRGSALCPSQGLRAGEAVSSGSRCVRDSRPADAPPDLPPDDDPPTSADY